MPQPFSTDRLRKLFWSAHWYGGPRGYREDVERLARWLEVGALTLEAVPYRNIPKPGAVLENSYAVALFDRCHAGSGGHDHGRLKWDAWHWCRDQFATVPAIERGQRDVVSVEKRIWIECGNTDPRFAFHDILHPNVASKCWDQFLVFPFGLDQAWRFQVPDLSHRHVAAWRTWRSSWAQLALFASEGVNDDQVIAELQAAVPEPDLALGFGTPVYLSKSPSKSFSSEDWANFLRVMLGKPGL